MNDTSTSMYVIGQHKNKAGLRQTRVYYPFASTHMVNTQLLRVKNMHTKCCKYFCGVFEFALAELCAKFAKINVPQIFPLLQYSLNILAVVMSGKPQAHFQVVKTSFVRKICIKFEYVNGSDHLTHP